MDERLAAYLELADLSDPDYVTRLYRLVLRRNPEAGVLDELCPQDELASRAVAMAKRMATQPAFRAVKQQIRGGLRERLAALAARRQDPFIAAFG